MLDRTASAPQHSAERLSPPQPRASSPSPSRTFTTGVNAIVRLVHAQAEQDRVAGLNTAGFITGYRGSPLGGLDQSLWHGAGRLKADQIHFQPAVNEELAATGIIGSQQAALHGDAVHDGVFALWYGKGVGADRAADALKHANLIGTSKHGGVLVLVGDDHGAVSSATAHQCEQAMASWMMPVLHPAHMRDFVRFGLIGFAMSRYAGCYVGFKAASEVIETGCTLPDADPHPQIVLPSDFTLPPDGVHIRWPDRQLDMEARLLTVKLKAAQAFARANAIDQTIWRRPGDRIGIVAVGKAHGDTMQALRTLGIDEDRAAELGLAVYKVGMPWPLEPRGIRAFSDGLDTLLVVEEKRAFVEPQIKDIFYDMPADRRPRILGKTDRDGGDLVPALGQITSDAVAAALIQAFPALRRRNGGTMAPNESGVSEPSSLQILGRPPFFCAGCPHNTSTQLPDGSRAHAGTGCHLMAAFMDRNTTSLIQMGGDGANWVGEAPFVKTDHIFQNLGDGTYVHSGSLAVRQAVAAGVNITFKLLYNDVVAMTGGQPLEATPRPSDISRQAAAEGVRRIAVVHDNRHDLGARDSYAPGTTFHLRDELDAVQRTMRETQGVTLILYVQTCATEVRRRRRRGIDPEPDQHIFINPEVCEGCGDCVKQSNCIALAPIETPNGIKRRVDQTMCNKDLSCLKGFCPAFVVVNGTRRQRSVAALPDQAIPQPEQPPLTGAYNAVVAGIGGTGVVTTGHLIGTAATFDEIEASVLDFTGLSQKGGNVVCHVRLAPHADDLACARIPAADADLLIAADLVVGAGTDVRPLLSQARSKAVANTYLQPTAAQVLNPDVAIDRQGLQDDLTRRLPEGSALFLNATRLAERITGNAMTANVFLVGHAFQMGWLPLSHGALLHAIESGGTEAAANVAAFEWGRLAAHDRTAFEAAFGSLTDRSAPTETTEQCLDRLQRHLEAYQDAAYGRRFRQLVDRVAAREQAIKPESQALTLAVANGYAKVLAYKDEYEVARLHAGTDFIETLLTGFEPGAKLDFHLAPEILGRVTADGKRPAKKRFGQWFGGALALLTKGKILRGTRMDPFAGFADRRAERRLITVYEDAMERILQAVTFDTHGLAVAIADLPQAIRGFGPVKQAAMDDACIRLDALIHQLEDGTRRPAAAE